MFRASNAHLQEDTVVHMQHMLLSLPMRIPVGLSAHRLSVYRQASRNSRRVTVPYAAFIQLYPPEDEHLMLETCRVK